MMEQMAGNNKQTINNSGGELLKVKMKMPRQT
jgi:hypothetical protein